MLQARRGRRPAAWKRGDSMSRHPLALMFGAIGVAAPAPAKVITVTPGPGTPLQDAIDGAVAGDTIKLEDGTYTEAVVIDKRLRLKGPRQVGLVAARIDAGCAAAAALTITADD